MKLIALLLLLSTVLGNMLQAQDFYAYYTRIDTGQSWEEYSRTSKHADLVVKVGNGEIIFHRSSSYLPFWRTGSGKWYFDELVPRRGDGTLERPDKNNLYSYVRLITESEDSIVVHWRYFPNFELGNHAQPVGGNVDFDGVVHEYFTFYPDGRVKRIVREGTAKLDEWNDPLNRTIQWLALHGEGIRQISLKEAALSANKAQKIEGNPLLIHERGVEACAVWHFDEGMTNREYQSKDVTFESLSGEECTVGGPKTVWKKGVSGTALGFDGYHSKVTSSSFKLPPFPEEGGFTLEAWVAPGAYSICRWSAIAHQSRWKADVRENIFQMRNWGEMQLGEILSKGYFLGIDEYGRPVVIMSINDQIVQVTSTSSIPLCQWSHVAFTYVDEGMLYLYVNGKVSDFINFSGHLDRSDAPFIIGKNDESIGYVSQHVVRTYSTFPSPLGFEGLIDEVKIYPEPLGHEEMYESFLTFRPSNPEADMQPRTLPGEVGPSESFGARYTKLEYHDLWDNMWREPEHPDVVVKFDLMHTSVVFWRGTRSPGWVTETNRWISDQSSELTDWHWGNETKGAQSCCEHMSDYQARHSHVRIIENTDARVVIHWRYASVDVLYKHPNACRNEDGWGVWTDEYLTIYPDGVGVRTVNVHGDSDYYGGPEGGEIGFHDTQFLSEAGTRPEDNIYPQSLTILSHADKITRLDWSERHPEGVFDAQVIWINLKSDYKVFEIFPPGTEINIWAGGEKTSYSKYSAWNHYPVTQAPCDGRFCVAPDRLAHSALGAADNLSEKGNMLLYGFTSKDAESLVPLARSWNHPPQISNLAGAEQGEYDKGERAYVLEARDDRISFTVDATEGSPLVHPCYIIRGWDRKVKVTVDGVDNFPDGKVRQGLVRDIDGKLKLILWLMIDSREPVSMEFKNETI